jgi:peptidylprolyl isomerase
LIRAFTLAQARFCSRAFDMRPPALLAALFALVAAPATAQTTGSTTAPAPSPVAAADPANTWLLDLSTGGRVKIRLRPDVAPNTVERIKTLTRRHFYDGLTFHRVIDGFMAQGGDPKGDGTGGSDLPDLKAEFNTLPHVRGAVAAARAQNEDSANSQFYIVLQPRLQLDRKYTVFGRVVDGMQYVDTIARGEPPSDPSRIVHAYIESDNPPAYVPAPPPSLGPVPSLTGATPPPGAATKAAPAATPTRKAPRRR